MLERLNGFWCLEHRLTGDSLLCRDRGRNLCSLQLFANTDILPIALSFLQTAMSPCILKYDYPAFLVQNLKMGGKRRYFMQRKRETRCPIWILLSSEQAFDRNNIVQVSRGLIWRQLNIKSPWMAPGQSAGIQVFFPPSCSSACLTEIPYIAYR